MVVHCDMSAADAACFASFWSVMMCLRAPPQYLHDARRRDTGARTLYGSGKLGICLTVGLIFGLITVSVASLDSGRKHSSSNIQVICFAIATGATAIHQFNSLQTGVTQSYLLVFFGNIALTTSCLASISTDMLSDEKNTNIKQHDPLARAINVSAPSIIEAYALLMLFTAFGKLNPRFFDAKISAATAHVMACIENCALWSTSLVSWLRKLVDNLGPQRMEAFFAVTAIAGALVEFLVGILMFCNMPKIQAVMMVGMHGMFALTAYDFSLVAAAVFPLWASMEQGSIASAQYLGWLATPYGRVVVPVLIVAFILKPAKDNDEKAKLARLHYFRLYCQVFFLMSSPIILFAKSDMLPLMPFGSKLVRISNETFWTDESALSEMGAIGAFAIGVARSLILMLSLINGFGPFVGIQTAGSYAVLYSNLIVEREREEDSNHYIVGPLKRVLLGVFGKLGLFNRQKEWELVTVIASDVESIRRQLVIAPVAPFKVFAGLVEKKGWERAGCCHWSAPMSPYIYTSVPGRENPITEKDAPNILPYVIPFFQLRCMISQIVSNEKGRDFYVIYEYKGSRFRFERKGGQTISPSDLRLTHQPNILLRKIMKYRPLPPDFIY